MILAVLLPGTAILIAVVIWASIEVLMFAAIIIIVLALIALGGWLA